MIGSLYTHTHTHMVGKVQRIILWLFIPIKCGFGYDVTTMVVTITIQQWSTTVAMHTITHKLLSWYPVVSCDTDRPCIECQYQHNICGNILVLNTSVTIQ